MKKDSHEEVVMQVLSETFEARNGHQGVLTRKIILAGHVIEAGSVVHFTQENGGAQSAFNSARKQYQSLNAVIHFGSHEAWRPRSTIRLRASGSEFFVKSVHDRSGGVALNPYNIGLTQRA